MSIVRRVPGRAIASRSGTPKYPTKGTHKGRPYQLSIVAGRKVDLQRGCIRRFNRNGAQIRSLKCRGSWPVRMERCNRPGQDSRRGKGGREVGGGGGAAVKRPFTKIRHSLLKRVNRGSKGRLRGSVTHGRSYERCTALHERLREIGQKKFCAARWSGGRSFEGRLRLRSKGCQHTGARTRDVRALHERLREIGQKNFARQDRRRELVRGSNRHSLWRGNARAYGRAVAGVEDVTNTRTLVREMYERCTSVYERSGKKNFRGRTGVERWSIIRTGTDFGGRYAGLP